MAHNVYVVYLLLISVTVCLGIWWRRGGAVMDIPFAVAAVYIVIPAALGALGFGAGGIFSGSMAAGAMATTAPVAIGQSTGAAGIGLGGKAIGGRVGYMYTAYCAIFDCN